MKQPVCVLLTVLVCATVSPENAANKDITWTSSNTAVAAVSGDGEVSFVPLGTARITATTADGVYTAACIVRPVPGARLNQILNVPFRCVPARSFKRDGTPENISIISSGYWMSETEVTQELFQAVMGTNPSSFTSGADPGETQNRRPVECVSWHDAIAFCNKLSLANGKEPAYCNPSSLLRLWIFLHKYAKISQSMGSCGPLVRTEFAR
jgi:hypothetical protein